MRFLMSLNYVLILWLLLVCLRVYCLTFFLAALLLRSLFPSLNLFLEGDIMSLAIDFMVWLHIQLLTVLDSISLAIGDYNVSFLDVIFGFLVIFMIIAVFWKGARA